MVLKMTPMRLQLARLSLILLPLVSLTGCSPEYPTCDTDTDCKDGEFCVNNMCQQCRADDDCGAGQSCASGACEAVDGYCTTTGECGDGENCENNACVTAQTSNLPAAAPAVTQSSGPCELDAIYFGYDSSSVETSARDQLGAAAACIKEKQLQNVHLTGLTDARGTEEYNMALGDRRARSAQSYLQTLGVEAELSYSSMGEEYASGTEEATWARDRRVDIKPR